MESTLKGRLSNQYTLIFPRETIGARRSGRASPTRTGMPGPVLLPVPKPGPLGAQPSRHDRSSRQMTTPQRMAPGPGTFSGGSLEWADVPGSGDRAGLLSAQASPSKTPATHHPFPFRGYYWGAGGSDPKGPRSPPSQRTCSRCLCFQVMSARGEVWIGRFCLFLEPENVALPMQSWKGGFC